MHAEPTPLLEVVGRVVVIYVALYERLAEERLGPRLKAWLEGGRAAAGDPRAD
jgi:hypothetical protein